MYKIQADRQHLVFFKCNTLCETIVFVFCFIELFHSHSFTSFVVDVVVIVVAVVETVVITCFAGDSRVLHYCVVLVTLILCGCWRCFTKQNTHTNFKFYFTLWHPFNTKFLHFTLFFFLSFFKFRLKLNTLLNYFVNCLFVVIFFVATMYFF